MTIKRKGLDLFLISLLFHGSGDSSYSSLLSTPPKNCIENMPKRARSSYSTGFRAKRARIGKITRRPARNTFVNQLGGWTQNKYKNFKPIERVVTLDIASANIDAGNPTRQLQIRMDALPESIRDSYQRIKIKKVETILFPRVLAPTNNGLFQFSACAVRQNTPAVNPLHVPGAQIKVFRFQTTTGTSDVDGVVDIMRLASFYPPSTVALVGAGAGSESLYLDTSVAEGYWTICSISYKGILAEGRPDLQLYFVVTLLCDGFKASTN